MVTHCSAPYLKGLCQWDGAAVRQSGVASPLSAPVRRCAGREGSIKQPCGSERLAVVLQHFCKGHGLFQSRPSAASLFSSQSCKIFRAQEILGLSEKSLSLGRSVILFASLFGSSPPPPRSFCHRTGSVTVTDALR